MTESGIVSSITENKIGIIEFYHPKSNSLPKSLLTDLKNIINTYSLDDELKVIILKSKGDGAFCGGASFQELLEINNFEQGKEFFMGFARLILAMKNCPKLIIARVQGKAVGGGVGIIAASDYVLAHRSASIRLSELDLGIGPFVVGPVIEKGIGKGAFGSLSIDTNWRTADWAEAHGLYSDVFETTEELDKAVGTVALKLSKGSSEAMFKFKSILWEGTDHWEKLLEERSEISGRLILSEFTKNFLTQYK